MFTYAIQYYVPFQILWIWILESQGPFKSNIAIEMCFRVALVLVTCKFFYKMFCLRLYVIFFVLVALAAAIPYLHLFISLVGAFSSTALALLIPPVLEFVMAWKKKELTAWVITRDVFIFIVGVLGTITGTFESIWAIVHEISEVRGDGENANLAAKHWVSW